MVFIERGVVPATEGLVLPDIVTEIDRAFRDGVAYRDNYIGSGVVSELTAQLGLSSGVSQKGLKEANTKLPKIAHDILESLRNDIMRIGRSWGVDTTGYEPYAFVFGYHDGLDVQDWHQETGGNGLLTAVLTIVGEAKFQTARDYINRHQGTAEVYTSHDLVPGTLTLHRQSHTPFGRATIHRATSPKSGQRAAITQNFYVPNKYQRK